MTYLEQYRDEIRKGNIIAGQELITALDLFCVQMHDPRFVYDTKDAYKRIAFMERFCKLTKSPFYGQAMKLMLWQKAFIETFYSFKWAETGNDRFKRAILLVARKNTKALALDTPILTPDGWRTIEDIHVGDYVYSELGKPVAVTGESEIFRNRVCYEVEFEDGEKIIADENHKWTVETKNSRKLLNYKPYGNRRRFAGEKVDDEGRIVITTADMVDDYVRVRPDGKGNEYKYRVPMAQAIEHEEKDLPLHPYILGLWLGDGDRNDNRISSGKLDLEEHVKNIEACRVPVSSVNEYLGRYEIRIGRIYGRVHKNTVKEALKELGVLKNKHIPESYLTASINQRIELLKGLMDTDGTVSKAGQCSFTQKSKIIVDGMSELLSSLGIKHNVRKIPATCNGIPCGEVFDICFWVDKEHSCFKLERKMERLKEKLASRMRNKSIVSIRRVENRDTKCITVDNPTSLFVCGLKNTVTHNSETCNALGFTELMIGQQGSDLVCSSNDDTQANILYDGINTMREQFDPKNKRTSKNVSFIRNKLTNSRVFKLSQSTRNKEGRNVDWAVIDEVHEMKDSTIINSIDQSMSIKINPKRIIITTEGFVSDGALDSELDYARKVLNGEYEDFSLMPWLYTQDSEAEIWQDERSWQKSNPTIGIVKTYDYLRERLNISKMSKSERVFTLCKDFNIKQATNESWLLPDDYDYETEPISLDMFRGCLALASVDLSETTDLTCCHLLLMLPDDNTKYVLSHYWIPENKLTASDDKTAGAKYKEWAREGLLTICEGNDNDLTMVADWVMWLKKTYDIRIVKCGYDQRFAKDFLNRMEEYGIDCEMIYQNATVMSNPMRLVEADLKSQLINYGGNPITRWCLGNACVQVDNLGRPMCVKIASQPNRRIDGAVNLVILYATYWRFKGEYMRLTEGNKRS